MVGDGILVIFFPFKRKKQQNPELHALPVYGAVWRSAFVCCMIVSHPRVAVRCRGLSTVHVWTHYCYATVLYLIEVLKFLITMKRNGVVITTLENNQLFNDFFMVSVFST